MSNFWKEQRRKTVRAETNPMDRSTIFSIYNRRIKDTKATLQPSTFNIEPGSPENPSRSLIEPASWWREIDPEQPLLEIPVGSVVLAESIVRDYCSGLLGYKPKIAMPGIFYLPGDISLIKLKTEYKNALDNAIKMQRAWYKELVNIADIGWSRTNGNPLAINDDMRQAAQELGMTNKDWMIDHQTVEQVRCIACGQLRNPAYPICQHCKAIADPVRAKELGLTFVA